MKHTGKLIVFEGADGTGKTTVASGVSDLAKVAGKNVLQRSFPGTESGTIGGLVYALHHDPATLGIADVSPSCLQALHIAAHLNLIEKTILPALRSGKWVILDRYWWSTMVYGRVSGVSEETLKYLIKAEKSVWQKRNPDAVVFLNRSHPINEVDDSEWQSVATKYRAVALEESKHYPVFEISDKGDAHNAIQLVATAVGLKT